jgi:tetratricopeptide (TPR) repeat protein
MKNMLTAFAALAAAAILPAQDLLNLPDSSPRGGVSQTIGITKVSVDYGRPAVNKREVWGRLVPFGLNDLGFGTTAAAPWRAGANVNTVVSFSTDVTVGGQPLPAGDYGLHMILAESGDVTAIFSKKSRAWGSFFYDPADDAARMQTKWQDAPHHELLTYEFSDITKNSATLSLLWETKRIPIPIAVDTDALVVASMKRELSTDRGFDNRAWIAGSQYLVQNNLDLNLALEWAERALDVRTNGRVDFEGLSNKALILEKLGRAAEADAAMDQALPVGSAVQIHQYGRRLIAAKKAERALQVFQLNVQKHPDVWPVNYGLARGYSAIGNYAAALEALLKAQKQVPAGDTLNPPVIEQNIEKLKRGEDIN